MDTTLGFTVEVRQTAFNGAFQKLVVKNAYEIDVVEGFLMVGSEFIAQVLTSEFAKHGRIKVFPILSCVYENPVGDKEQTIASIAGTPFIISKDTDIMSILSDLMEQLVGRSEDVDLPNENMRLVKVSQLELGIAELLPQGMSDSESDDVEDDVESCF